MNKQLCDYGCGKEAKYQFKNGTWCCSKSCNSCLVKRKFNKKFTEEHKNKLRNAKKITIEQIKVRYPLFSKIEEMRYNPVKPIEEKEIQVHCKNHECPNSKEQDGWFTPTKIQLSERRIRLEKLSKINNYINNNSYFYCSKKCKENSLKYQNKNTRKNLCNFRSKMNSGIGNPNWKGGISCEPYCEQWIDKEYKESIKERDGHICLNPACLKKTKNLCLHHIDYNKKNCHPNNLITLCFSCNGKANKDRDWHKSWYNIIIFNRYIRRNL